MTGTSLPNGYDRAGIRKFIDTSKTATSEAWTAQSCFRDPCMALDVQEPAKGAEDPTYQFERPVPVPASEKVEKKSAHVFRRGTFVWENRELKNPRGRRRWLDGMRRAYGQAKGVDLRIIPCRHVQGEVQDEAATTEGCRDE